DEPTSALDPEMINEVLDVMVALAKEGMTMMVVTHEMGFARRVANRVVFMDRGQIVEDAPTAEFFGKPRSERAQVFLSKLLQHCAARLVRPADSLALRGSSARGAINASREQRHLLEPQRLGKAEHEIHVLHGLPRGALAEIVERRADDGAA